VLGVPNLIEEFTAHVRAQGLKVDAELRWPSFNDREGISGLRHHPRAPEAPLNQEPGAGLRKRNQNPSRFGEDAPEDGHVPFSAPDGAMLLHENCERWPDSL